MPALGLTVETISGSTLKLTFRNFFFDEQGNTQDQQRMIVKYVKTRNISFNVVADTRTNEQSLEVFDNGKLLCSFSETYPDSVANVFDGDGSITGIENILTNIMVNNP